MAEIQELHRWIGQAAKPNSENWACSESGEFNLHVGGDPCLSDIGATIRVVGIWWCCWRGRASTSFSAHVSSLVSGFDDGDHSVDKVFKNLSLDLAPLRYWEASSFFLLRCWRTGCHGICEKKTESEQGRGSDFGMQITIDEMEKDEEDRVFSIEGEEIF